MIGRRVSHYEILERLGGGGMGVVYKAQDTKLERLVALKFLPPERTRNEAAKQRFIREARSASALDHQNICTIYEIDETDDGQMFISMAFCEGQTLKKKLVTGPLTEQESMENARQIAQGLARAHEADIIHRDIKPANVIITDRGEVKIVDFGLAKLIGQSRITQPGLTVGTVAYMSPEQTRGDDVDQRTDLWSLGVVLNEMLSGQLPFKGDSDQALIYSILNEEPKSVSTVEHPVSTDLESVVHKCLQKNPEDRYGSAYAILDELQHVGRTSSDETTRLISETQPESGPAPRKWRRVLWLLPILVLGLLLVPGAQDTVRRFLGFGEVPAQRSVALLPITVVGGDSADKALGDGLVQTTTEKLSRLEQYEDSFWVMPANVVQYYQVSSTSAASGLLGADVAITGTLNKYGDMYRLELAQINLSGKSLRQIISPRTTRQLTDPLSNLATWQDDVGRVVAELLGLQLQPAMERVLQQGGTTIPGAYAAYLQGCGYLAPYGGVSDLARAIAAFSTALGEDASFACAHVGLARAYWDSFDGENEELLRQAFDNCEQALALDAQLLPAHYLMGQMQRGQAELELSSQSFQRCLEIDPNHANAHRELAYVYEALGKFDSAEQTLEHAVELRPNYAIAYNNLGYFYYVHNQYQEAAEQYRLAVDIAPDYLKGYNNLGATYFSLERYDEAKQVFQRSLAIEPTYAAYSNLGTLFFYDQRFADAGRMYEEALKITSSDYRIHGYAAESYRWAGAARDMYLDYYNDAITLAEEARAVTPSDFTIVAYLVGYYLALGEQERATSYLEQLLAQPQLNSEVAFRLACAYEQLGDREQAMAWLTTALEQEYTLAEIESYPGLRELRADQKYRDLVQSYITSDE